MGVGGGVGQQMVRHAARDVGCHGWGESGGRQSGVWVGGYGVQINGCGRGYFFPKVPAGMTRRVRVGVVIRVCERAPMRALACVKAKSHVPTRVRCEAAALETVDPLSGLSGQFRGQEQ